MAAEDTNTLPYERRPEVKARRKAYRQANLDLYRKASKEYYWRNAEFCRDASRQWHHNNKEQSSAKTRAYWAANKDRLSAANKARYQERKDEVKRGVKEWCEKNRDRWLERKRQWRARNPHKGGEYMALRRARVKAAMPPWADVEKMREIYAEAKRTGQTVDHIVPLRSKIVCGLHAHTNLRVIPKRENNSKFNRFWPDMPD